MVQPKYSPEEALEKMKLMMKQENQIKLKMGLKRIFHNFSR